MITSHNKSYSSRASIDGIEVIYLPVAYDNSMSFSSRGIAFIKFMFLACIESMKQRHIDICYVMTTPLSTGMVALFNKCLLRRPYLFEVGDLWPKVPIEMGLIKSKWKIRLLEWLEGMFYKKAKGLVGLSDPITAHLASIAPEVPVKTIFNIANHVPLLVSKPSKGLPAQTTAPQFVIAYTGTFGLANDLERVVVLAESVQDLPILFLLVGDGAEKQKITQLLVSKALSNVKIYDFMSKNEVLEIVGLCDALLVSFAPVESLHTGSPNKFFDSLGAGKLVITNFRGWIGDLIESEKCGFVAENELIFRQRIMAFLNDRQMLGTYQQNARQLGKHRFSLEVLSKKQLSFIQRLVT